MAFTVTMMSWSIIEYGKQMTASGEFSYAMEAIKWGTDYFIKAHPQTQGSQRPGVDEYRSIQSGGQPLNSTKSFQPIMFKQPQDSDVQFGTPRGNFQPQSLGPLVPYNQGHEPPFHAGGSHLSRIEGPQFGGPSPGDIRLREVKDLFYKYGPIVDIDLKIPSRPLGYAFVEFEDARDAEDAICYRDGYNFDGFWLRVEFAHGGRGYSSSVDYYSSYRSSGGSRGVSRRSDYRVLVIRLLSSASWQDLKDYMHKVGDICFSQVFRERGGMTGIVGYTDYDDMKYAIRKLDDSEFRNAFSRAYTWVSATWTDESTCTDGFQDTTVRAMNNRDMKSVVRRRIMQLAQLTNNALALINQLATSHA